MSEPLKTNKTEKAKQRRKEPVKIRTNVSLYNTGDIEEIAYSERSERYPI